MSQIPDLNLPYESDPEDDMDFEFAMNTVSIVDSIFGGPAEDWEEPTGLAYWGYTQSQVSDVLVVEPDPSGIFEEYFGTSKTVIEKFDSFVDDDNVVTCAVCLEEMNAGKQLPCSHRFHENCIQLWLLMRNTCPVCRHWFPTNHMCNPNKDFDIMGVPLGHRHTS